MLRPQSFQSHQGGLLQHPDGAAHRGAGAPQRWTSGSNRRGKRYVCSFSGVHWTTVIGWLIAHVVTDETSTHQPEHEQSDPGTLNVSIRRGHHREGRP